MAKKKQAAEDHIVDANEMINDDLPFIDTPELPSINEELKATLVKYPHIDCVYMNEQGDWHFAAKPGFTAFSREQILNG